MIIVLAKAIPINRDAKYKIIDFADDLIINSRKEEGNIAYELLINAGEASLLFVEQWESKQILDNHLQTEHFIKFGENISDLLAMDLIIQVFSAEEIVL